jgi:hypothetical protein
MFKVTVNLPEFLTTRETIMPTIADVCEHIQETLIELPEDIKHWSILVTDTAITYREKE